MRTPSRVRVALALAVAAGLLVVPAAAQQGTGGIETIPGMPPVPDRNNLYSETRPDKLSPAVANALPRVYVPNLKSNDVYVIDPATLKVVDRFRVGINPQHIVPSHDLKTLWVTNNAEGRTDGPQDADAAKLVIECPGATLYDVETGAVLQGVKWHDPDDVSLGFEIVGKAIMAQGHVPRRVIESESAGKITRCRACQDFTVRMRAQQRDHTVQGPSAARRRAENLFKK